MNGFDARTLNGLEMAGRGDSTLSVTATIIPSLNVQMQNNFSFRTQITNRSNCVAGTGSYPSRSLAKNARKPQSKLTREEAVEIFRFKDCMYERGELVRKLSKQFGIGQKAVRDIWNGRTWNRETLYLDIQRESKDFKTIGRPKGSKDKKPRMGKAA